MYVDEVCTLRDHRFEMKGHTTVQRSSILVLVITLLVTVSSNTTTADIYASSGSETSEASGTAKAVTSESSVIPKDALDSKQKSIVRYSLLVGVPAVTFGIGMKAWDWGETNTWRWNRERWFQADTYSGGADKVGHFYTHYVFTRSLSRAFSYTEDTPERAALYSVLTTSLIGTMIEVGDAFTGTYGFSYEDLIADHAGIALAYAMDRYPTLNNYVGVTAFYWPTRGFLEYDTPFNFASDYSGWTFTLNFKLSGFHRSGYNTPPILRFLQIDYGYYTRNYTRFDEYANKPPTRHRFLGLSVNARELLGALPNANGLVDTARRFLRFIYLPPMQMLGRDVTLDQ